MIKNVYWSSRKVTVFFCQVVKKVEFCRQTFEKYSNFMTFRLVGAKLLHGDGRTNGQTEGQTDMKQIVAFWQFFESA